MLAVLLLMLAGCGGECGADDDACGGACPTTQDGAVGDCTTRATGTVGGSDVETCGDVVHVSCSWYSGHYDYFFQGGELVAAVGSAGEDAPSDTCGAVPDLATCE